MAENIPNVPAGAVPPKKETGKVQPKKETVRINLPPKPSAAPTIKLPTLPPGGPTGAPTVAGAPAAASSAPALAVPRASAAPVAQKSLGISGGSPNAPAPTAAASQRPAGRPVVRSSGATTVSGLDIGLAVGAMVAGLLALGSVIYLAFMYSTV